MFCLGFLLLYVCGGVFFLPAIGDVTSLQGLFHLQPLSVVTLMPLQPEYLLVLVQESVSVCSTQK